MIPVAPIIAGIGLVFAFLMHIIIIIIIIIIIHVGTYVMVK
jgi:hypothetical protein